ncbi:hypothetical protein HD806DRAFT_532178 [Xylariaceae sp. AK1471]|nr:hypothetical protein HD806DRAFT_532178 [Xylariaceae sp. AK1471]
MGNNQEAALSKRQINGGLKVFLEAAHASLMHLGGKWTAKHQNFHGEGRSAPGIDSTYHIVAWKQTGNRHHISAISVSTGKGKPKRKLLAGSKIDHGLEEPDPLVVLNKHKAAYGVSIRTPAQANFPYNDNTKEGAGVGGQAWAKTVCKDCYDGFYYLGWNSSFHECDEDGNDISTGGI